DPSNMQWQRDLSISYEKVGYVLAAQGKLDEALKAYRDRLAIAERLATADPSNTEWQGDLSTPYERDGEAPVAKGRLDEALRAYRDSLVIAERLAATDPSNTRLQSELQFRIDRFGAIAYNFILAHNFATALEAVDQAISLAPDKVWLYTNRAHALMFLDRIDEARALYLKYRRHQN